MYKVPGAGVGATGGGVGTLAATGADIGWWLVFGAALIILGAAVLVASYRRSRRLAPQRD